MASVKFTVFGARGFIGRHLVAYLQSCGHQVLCPEAREAINSQESLGNIIYSIGLTGDFRSRPHDTVEAHVSLFSRLLQTLPFDSLTYLSSTRIYASVDPGRRAREDDEISFKPSHDSLYGLSKLTGEALCMSSSNPLVRIARLSNVYGTGMSANNFLGSIIDRLNRGHNVEIGEGPLSAKDYIAVSDVCKCLEYISTRGRHRIYNVASGRNTTHSEIVERLKPLTNKEITFKYRSTPRRFPQIDNTRLLGEFPFEPKSVIQDVAELLDARSQSN
jgi:nucleoside-diphosphate-sugar epimerase